MAYNPALEQLRKQAEQRLYQKRLQEQAAREENFKMKSLFDPLLNIEGRKRLGGDNWFETTFLGYKQLFDSNYIEWFRNPGQALINNLTAMGDTLDYAANLIKAPLLAAVKGENVGTRLLDAYGLGDNGRITQNMADLREVIGAAPSGIIGGTAAGALIGLQAGGPWGAAIGAGIGVVAGIASGVAGELGADVGNTITDMALEYVVDPANVLGAIKSAKAVSAIKNVTEVSEESGVAAIKNYRRFIADDVLNINKEDILDTIMVKNAKHAELVVASGRAKDATKVFNKNKKAIMKAYFDNDYKAFSKEISKLGMFADSVGMADGTRKALTTAKVKQMFDTLVKDANLSRAYRIMGAFDRFDSNFSRLLLKATPMGIAYTGVKKGIVKASKEIGRYKNMANFMKASNETPLNKTVFQELDDLGIDYKQTPDMSYEDTRNLYKNLLTKADEFEKTGDPRKLEQAYAMRGVANRIVFKDGVHQASSVKQLQSDLNYMVKKYMQYSGDIDKLMADPKVREAYIRIADGLSYDLGSDVLFDYITKNSHNKFIANALRGTKRLEFLAEKYGIPKVGGAHLALADVLGSFAKVDIDADPSMQYKKTLKELSDKIIKQKEGQLGAERQMRYTVNSLQRKLVDRLENATLTPQIELNKAIILAERKSIDLSVAGLLNKQDRHLVYKARHLAKRLQVERAKRNLNLEDFVKVSNMTLEVVDNEVAKQQEVIKNLNIKINEATKVGVLAENAESALMALKKITADNAEQALNETNKAFKEKQDKQIEEAILEIKKCLAEEYEGYVVDPTVIRIRANEANAKATKLYASLRYFTNMNKKDMFEFVKRMENFHKRQLYFIKKYAHTFAEIESLIAVLKDSGAYKNRAALGELNSLQNKQAIKQLNNWFNAVLNNKPLPIIENIEDMEAINNVASLISENARQALKLIHELTPIRSDLQLGLSKYGANLEDAFEMVKNPNSIAFMTYQANRVSLAAKESLSVLEKNSDSIDHDVTTLFDKYFNQEGVAQDIVQEILDYAEEYANIAQYIIEHPIIDGKPNLAVEMLQNLTADVKKFTENKWNVYTSYVYFKHYLNDYKSIYGRASLENMHKGTVHYETIERIVGYFNSIANAKVDVGIQKMILKENFNVLENLIQGRQSIKLFNIRKGISKIEKEMLFKDATFSLKQIFEDPRSLIRFINDSTTVIKALRTVEYIAHFYVKKKKFARPITQLVNQLGATLQSMVHMYEDYTHTDPKELQKIVGTLTNFHYNLNNLFDSIHRALDADINFRFPDKPPVPISEYNPKMSANYNTKIDGADLTDTYITNSKEAFDYNFLKVDSGTVRIITEHGAEEVPDDLDIDLIKFKIADIETYVRIKQKGAPTPEEIVQIAITTPQGPQNIIVYSPDYETHGIDKLLDANIVNGKFAEEYANELEWSAFKEGLTDHIEFTTKEGNTYVMYSSVDGAFKAMYEPIKDSIIEHNGKLYLPIIGHNATKFDDPALLAGLNKYANANLEGIISEDSLPMIQLFRGLAKVRKVLNPDNAYNLYLQKNYTKALAQAKDRIAGIDAKISRTSFEEAEIERLSAIQAAEIEIADINNQLSAFKDFKYDNERELKYKQAKEAWIKRRENLEYEIKNKAYSRALYFTNEEDVNREIARLQALIKNPKISRASKQSYKLRLNALVSNFEVQRAAREKEFIEELHKEYADKIAHIENRIKYYDDALLDMSNKVTSIRKLLARKEAIAVGINHSNSYIYLKNQKAELENYIAELEEKLAKVEADIAQASAAKESQLIKLLEILDSSPTARLEDIYKALLNGKFEGVADLSGIAHDASYDIKMTEEVIKAIHSAMGEVNTLGRVKTFLNEIASGYTRYNSDTIKAEVSNLENSIKSVINSLNHNVDKDKLKPLFSTILETNLDEINDFLDPTVLKPIYDMLDEFLDYYSYLEYKVLKGQIGANDEFFIACKALLEDVEEAYTNIENILKIREAAVEGTFGDAVMKVSPNRHWAYDTLTTYWQSARNNAMFVALKDIFTGTPVDGFTDYSLVGLVQRYAQQYGDIETFKAHLEDLSRLYNYTDRIDAAAEFDIAFNDYLKKALAPLGNDDKRRMEYLQAFSRIQDKLFGYGTSNNNLSLDGWFRKIVAELKAGYRLDIANNTKAKLEMKFTKDLEIIKDEIKRLVYLDGKLSDSGFFKDIIDDLLLFDNDGGMVSLITNYINDCINNLDKYDIWSRKDKALTLLRPAADRQYWNFFRNTYQDIIDNFKYNTPGAVVGQTAPSYKAEGLNKSVGIYEKAETELREFMSDVARQGLQEVNLEYAKCKVMGNIPEGFIATKHNKNTWDINANHNKYNFIRNDKSKMDYAIAGIRNKFYEMMGVEFDPSSVDPIKYKPAKSKVIAAIENILNADKDNKYAPLYVNELYEIINEFDITNKPYISHKVNVYAEIYDAVATAYPDKASVMIRFAEDVFEGTFNYLDEAKQKDVVLRKQYENMFKAIAVSAYLAKANDTTIADVFAKINYGYPLLNSVEASFMGARKTLTEMNDQIMDLFKIEKGVYNYEAMFNYINDSADLDFVILKKSNKYFKGDTPLHEITKISVKSPEELQALVEAQMRLKRMKNTDDMFSLIDNHTFQIVKKRIGQTADNRVYKFKALNLAVKLRRFINTYIMAPMKSLSLFNVGFTVTNAVEGALKTIISSDGDRRSIAKRYSQGIKSFKQWQNLSYELAKAVQGSPFWSMKDQLALLEYEKIIGDRLFNIDANGQYTLSKAAWLNLKQSKLPDYITNKYKKFINEAIVGGREKDLEKYITRYKRVSKLYNELYKYDLDDFKAFSEFVNSEAAASEFQSIKRSAELNVIGKDKNDNAVQRALNSVLYSDKWIPGDKNLLRHFTPYANLSRNSDIELINRYAMYLDLVENGYVKNEALNKVLAAHFNYSNKSNWELSLELLVPFISFPLRNFMFWNEALDEHPELLKVFIDMTITNWGDEKDNQYNQTKITKGGIRLWGDVSVESGLSVFDAMAFGGNALNVLTQRKLNPLVSVAIEGAKQLAVGQSSLDYRLQRLPIMSHIKTGSELVGSLQKGKFNPYDIAPSLFNEVYKNNRYYYNNQGRYAYKSAYSRLYTSTGFNRHNGSNKLTAIRYKVIR